jgi:hypothetical protein
VQRVHLSWIEGEREGSFLTTFKVKNGLFTRDFNPKKVKKQSTFSVNVEFVGIA